MSEKIINRVQKMLAIANDLAATEQERDTALSMAYKVLAHHNLSMADLPKDAAEIEPRGAYETQNFSFPFAKDICSTIAQLFFCEVIYQRKINASQMQYSFVGREGNAATAMVMADYIIKSIMKEGRKLYKQNTSPGCRSFCVGAAHKLAQRVRKMKADEMAAQAQESTGRELALVSLYAQENADNDAFISANMNVRIIKPRASTIADATAYNSGKSFGATINLALQVGGSNSPTPKALK